MQHVLTTDRLELRPVAAADLADLLAHWTDPDVRRFLFDGEVLTAERVAEVIADSERDVACGLWQTSQSACSPSGGSLSGVRPGSSEA
ncbi:N-acetyltransferase, partial [Nonomuraea sp. NPDC055795]